MFLAGTGTTAASVIWALVYLAEQPEVLRKMQEEIDDTVGRETTVTISDIGECQW